MPPCDQVRERLIPYAADQLGAAERREIAGHLSTCLACAAELRAWQAIAQGTRAESQARAGALPDPTPLLARLAAEARPRPGGQAPPSASESVVPGNGPAPGDAAGDRRGWRVGLLVLLALLALLAWSRVDRGPAPLAPIGPEAWPTDSPVLRETAGRAGGPDASAGPAARTPASGAAVAAADDDDERTRPPSRPARSAAAAPAPGGFGFPVASVTLVASATPVASGTAIATPDRDRPGSPEPRSSAIPSPKASAPPTITTTPAPGSDGTPDPTATQAIDPTATQTSRAAATPTASPTTVATGLAGWVRGPDGTGRAEIPIRARRPGAALGDFVEALSQADGSFALALAPGAWILSAESPDHPLAWSRGAGAGSSPDPREAVAITLGPGQAPGEIAFQLATRPTERIVGQVLDAAGAPIPGALLLAESLDGASPGVQAALADAAGNYALPLDPGRYRLGASTAWFEPPRLWWPAHADPAAAEPITVESGGPAPRADFRLP